MSLHIAVIGAGIVGAASAVALTREGHRVTIVEPGEPGHEQSASYGNGAWLSPASVVPMSMPGLWKKVPGYLLDPLGPLTIRITELPHLLPWLMRFLCAGATVSRVEATAQALSALLSDSPARHAKLAEEAGVQDLIQQTGLLYVYPDRSAFAIMGCTGVSLTRNSFVRKSLRWTTDISSEFSLRKGRTARIQEITSQHSYIMHNHRGRLSLRRMRLASTCMLAGSGPFVPTLAKSYAIEL
jgi:2-polyprenyl-6-methoxyphenol hydroxylase-like FAD-dependent oxidoreductase